MRKLFALKAGYMHIDFNGCHSSLLGLVNGASGNCMSAIQGRCQHALQLYKLDYVDSLGYLTGLTMLITLILLLKKRHIAGMTFFIQIPIAVLKRSLRRKYN